MILRLLIHRKKLLLFGLLVSIYILLHKNSIHNQAYSNTLSVPTSVNSAPTSVHSESCIFPSLDPFDPSILPFIANVTGPIECKEGSQKNLTYIDDRSARLCPNFNNISEYSCFWQPFEGNVTNEHEIIFGEVYTLRGCVDFSQFDFIQVWCLLEKRDRKEESHKVYDNVFAHPRHIPGAKPSGEEQLSVLMYVQDSVSMPSARRNIPTTLNYFVKEMGGFLFNKYNKLGSYSPPNWYPFIAGLYHDDESQPIDEVSDLTDWTADGRAYLDRTADSLAFSLFKRRGYVTSFIEDNHYNGIFWRVKGGFRNSSNFFTHHYRPYVAIRNRKVTESAPIPIAYRETNSFIRANCLGETPLIYSDLDLMRKTVETYKDKLHFSVFSLQTLSHDQANDPLQIIDHRLTDILKRMEPNLNHTVLIIMSDHGLRYGRLIGSTHIGYLEDRNPLFGIRLPPWFLKKHPHIDRALRRNVNVLSTHFDTYATLLDILHGNFDESPRNLGFNRGVSQLRALPERSCTTANIPSVYCLCDMTLSKDVGTKTATIDAAEATVKHINTLLQQFKQCAVLRIARLSHSAKIGHTFTGNRETILLSMDTFPNNGQYKARVEKQEDGTWNVLEVYRTNAYGSGGSCLDGLADGDVKQHCHCIT